MSFISRILPKINYNRWNHRGLTRAAAISLRACSGTRPLVGGVFEVSDDAELVRDLSIMDSRMFVYSETDPTEVKPTSTQVLTFNELFDVHHSSYSIHREMYEDCKFENFQEISYEHLRHFGDCSFFVRSEYRPLHDANGDRLKQYVKGQRSGPHSNGVIKVATAGTGCYVTMKDNVVNTRSYLIKTAAHTVATFCGSFLEKIYDSNSPDIAGKLESISILTRGPNQQYFGDAQIEYFDPDHDIAILRCSTRNPCSMRIADFDINKDVEGVREIMNGGYHAELQTTDSTGNVIDDKRIINVFGDIGELSFCSMNQDYVDKNDDIKNKQLAYSKNKKILNPKKDGKLEVYTPLLKARSGGGVCIKPREIIGVVIEESLVAKYNIIQIATDQVKDKVAELESELDAKG